MAWIGSHQNFNAYKNNTLKFRIKHLLSAKYNHTCQFCGKQGLPHKVSGYIFTKQRKTNIAFEYHHLIPLEFGGCHLIENLILLCRFCHRSYFHTKEGEKIWLGLDT